MFVKYLFFQFKFSRNVFFPFFFAFKKKSHQTLFNSFFRQFHWNVLFTFSCLSCIIDKNLSLIYLVCCSSIKIFTKIACFLSFASHLITIIYYCKFLSPLRILLFFLLFLITAVFFILLKSSFVIVNEHFFMIATF